MAGAKETPRQKMIGMMYLVLTALLALNISKEVLDGFVKVENSLLETQATLDTKLKDTYTALEGKYSSNPEKVGPFFDEAQKIKDRSDELIKYIRHFKARCLSASSGDYDKQEKETPPFNKYIGEDDNGVDSTLNLKLIKVKDEYQNLTGIIVGGDPSNPKKGKWTAHGLKLAIEQYRDFIVNIGITDVDSNYLELPESNKRSLTKRFTLGKLDNKGNSVFDEQNIKLADGGFEIRDDEVVFWEIGNFYEMPIAAVIPLLSKLIIDVQDSAEDAVGWLLSSTEAKSLKFSEVMPLTIPQSNYILRGDTVRANIFLAAFDRTKKPEVYVDTEKWDGQDSTELDYVGLGIEPLDVNDQGQGLLAMSSKGLSLGQYQYKGVIRYQGPEGNMQSQQFFTPKFTIAEAALVVSPTKMNVFYRGVPNPVEISVPGVANNKLRVSISDGHSIKKQSDGTYIVEPVKSTSKKVAIISVKGEMPDGSISNLGQSEFRVKRIPDPVPFWAGKRPSDRTITKNEVLSFAPLAAKMDNFDFDVKVRVKSFTIRVSKDGTFKDLNSPNNRLSNDMKALLERVRRGNVIYFEDIVVGMPDGSQRVLAPMKLKITS
jgi:gliding motility-associated protein GldM